MPATRFDFARFVNVRAAYAPAFTPDGEQVLFLSTITGVPQLWSQPLHGGWPHQLTYYAERISGVQPAPDGSVLFSMDKGGNEHDALYLLSADASTVTPLTTNARAIHRAGFWAPDGARFAYAVNDRDPRFFDIYMIDLSEGVPAPPRLLFEDDHTNAAGAWSPDGRTLLIHRTHTHSNHDLYLLDLETAALRHLTPHEGGVRYEDAVFSRDGASLLLLTDHGRDFLSPARLEIETGALEFLDDAPHDAESLSLSPGGAYLAYALNVDGYSQLRLCDLTSGATLPSPDLPPGVIQAGAMPGAGLFAWSPDSRQIAFAYHSPLSNLNIWRWVPETGELAQLTFAPDGGIPRSAYVMPSLVHYPTFDGLRIPAFYSRPAQDGGALPVVVLVHGGPADQSRPVYNERIAYFVDRGYAVFVPNVRGSTGYGKMYSHLDDVRRRMDSVRDLAACVEWLVREGNADPKRIAVMGSSYGGFMTLAAVANYPDLWAAGVDIVGIANFRTFLENTGPFRRRLREAEYGNLDEDGEFLDEVSPIHKAGEIRAPMIILHGANDPRVPVGESEQIARILREREIPVEYHRYPDEGHGLVKLPNKVHGYTAIGDFLDRYLTR